MLAVIEIGLTIGAWKRGWKGWALLPFCIACLSVIFMFQAGIITFTNLWALIFVDCAVIAALSLMVAKPRWNSQPDITGDIGSSVAPIAIESLSRPIAPVAVEPIMKLAAIESSHVFQPAFVVSGTAGAKLILPDSSEISLTEAIKPIGRSDFDKVVAPEVLSYISRNHFVIRYDNCQYFVEDLDSTNGTKTNGIDIRNKGKQEIKDGDRIEVADLLELTFKATN